MRCWETTTVTGLSAFLHKIVVVDRSQRTSLTDFMSDPWLNEDGPVRERLLKLGLTDDDLQYRDRSVGRVLTFDGPLVDAMVSQFHFDRRGMRRPTFPALRSVKRLYGT